MRELTPGLCSPRPLAGLLPAVLQEDPVVLGLAAGLDEVLAPAFAALDCLEAYFDPRLAPADFLDLLAAWVGVVLDESWPEEHRRDVVANAVDLHRCRGTVHGLRWQLDLATRGRAEVVDSGGARWSRTPSPDAPGQPPALVVRVRRDGLSDAEFDALDSLVAWAKPAHVPHRIETVD